MRLSVAGAAKDAQVQNDILLSDFTRNLVVVGQQPHRDPNFASYAPSPCCGASASCLRTLLGATSWSLEWCCFASFQLLGYGLLFVVVFSRLLPLCCYHFTLYPLVGSLIFINIA